jgi:glycosyltransferase involved in cell wall biosynthesis
LDNIYLTIVIPAHNEEKRLPGTLAKIHSYLQSQDYPAEVLIVENASQDRTLAIAQEFAGQHPEFRVIHEAGRGKGLAVQKGMLAAHGIYRFMCDADLSMPIEEIYRFLPPQSDNYDIAIGSREAPGAIRYNEPFYRHFGGRVINSIIRWLALPGLQDTQCGFKCFRADIAEDLFRSQTLPGWSFDIEVLYIARLRNYRIVEIPIPWYYNPDSKLNAYTDALKMSKDILKIRENKRRGIYVQHAGKV